jgi:2-hydroxychromene-2-carboxylate isomerase
VTGRAPLEFWFEFASTYSYPAAMRIESVARAAGVPIAWRPFLLGPIFRAQGWNDSPFNIYPAKGRYMWRDMERICAELGVPLKRPSVFPRNGLLAARVACRFAEEPWCPAFVRAVYRANFADDREIAEPEVIADCLREVGQDGPACVTASTTTESKDFLRGQSERASALGLVGAPSFTVGDEIFWGNDRLEAALAWWKKHAAE